MGGNIFKDSSRYSAVEYRELYPEVMDKLENIVNDRVNAIPSYRTKESFGDLDILVESDNLPANWKQLVIEVFGLSEGEYSSNGNVFSILYKNFQIDLICMSSENYASAYFYYEYNDLGNLLGRLTHKMGIKFGHKGLSLIIRDKDNKDHIIKEIIISQDIQDVLDILKLDSHKFYSGFDTLEDIFKFVASSPYFNPEIYLLENRNHYSKTRDKKRQTYSNFLIWCDKNKAELNHFDWGTKTELGGYSIREPWYSEIVLKQFPHVKDEVDTALAEYELDKEFKKHFSGGIVRDITGLEGKEVGDFFKLAKSKLLSRYSKKDVIDMPDDLLYNIIRAMKFFWDNGRLDEYPIFDYDKAKELIDDSKPRK